METLPPRPQGWGLETFQRGGPSRSLLSQGAKTIGFPWKIPSRAKSGLWPPVRDPDRDRAAGARVPRPDHLLSRRRAGVPGGRDWVLPLLAGGPHGDRPPRTHPRGWRGAGQDGSARSSDPLGARAGGAATPLGQSLSGAGPAWERASPPAGRRGPGPPAWGREGAGHACAHGRGAGGERAGRRRKGGVEEEEGLG